MDIERLNNLASLLDQTSRMDTYATWPVTAAADGKLFNMADFYMRATIAGNECQTPSCICGHTIHTWGRKGTDLSRTSVASELLGLGEGQGAELFFAHGALMALNDIKPGHAAQVLRHLAETGDVDWQLDGWRKYYTETELEREINAW